jgi:toxin ParE1/3/4
MKVIWGRRAMDHLAAVADYIAADNPGAAARVSSEIRRRVKILATMPHIGRPGRIENTRELIIGSYIVAYRVRDETVEVVAVLHGARQWPDAF